LVPQPQGFTNPSAAQTRIAILAFALLYIRQHAAPALRWGNRLAC
jgi:hypothetical protein